MNREIVKMLRLFGSPHELYIEERIEELEAQVERMTSALRDIQCRSAWHCDEKADVEDTSPDDMVAHTNGIIFQICKKELVLLGGK